MRKSTLLVAGFFLFLLFFLFSAIVKRGVLEQFDFNTLIGIQNAIPKSFDLFLSFLSLLGSFEIVGLTLVAILYLRKKREGVLVFLIFASSHIIELLGKAFLHHPGPPLKFVRYNIPFIFPTSSVEPGFSYPSGHSLRMIFIAVILFWIIQNSPRFSKSKKYLIFSFLFFISLITLLSRVSLGEHWISDVIGGSLLGAAFGFFSLIFI